jgi:hypothetical protein
MSTAILSRETAVVLDDSRIMMAALVIRSQP